MTLQQIVLSKNLIPADIEEESVLTLQQIVLSKNIYDWYGRRYDVLTLQQIVLSKNSERNQLAERQRFDFTTNCSF